MKSIKIKNGKIMDKINSLIKEINEMIDYEPISYRPIYPREFKLPIGLDVKKYNDSELYLMYVSSLEFQEIMEQYFGKCIYRLSQRNTKKNYARIELSGFMSLVHKRDLYEIPSGYKNIFLLVMEKYFTSINYITKNNRISEDIRLNIDRKDNP